MTTPHFSRYSFLCLLSFLVIDACKSDSTESQQTTNDTIKFSSFENPPPSADFTGKTMEVKTFSVIDSATNRSSGWGYDIFIDGKRNIHQPIIPAIPGNRSFSTEEKANKAGLFALEKMKKTGTLPTLSIAELDSLGVTK